MAHLITSHDPYHVHKLLGLLVLLHYFYRFYLLATTGAFFPQNEPLASYAASKFGFGATSAQICGVLLHGLLSWSSLLLPLPGRRNFSKPMIWPEFRLHSILFATRHVVCTVISLADMWPDALLGKADGSAGEGSNFRSSTRSMALNCIARAMIVLGTVKLASLITDRYGCRDNRTTNAMPYPPNVTDEERLKIKKMYTAAQFGATVTCLCDDANMNFAPILGIQMAALLMTLVRKGKISTANYHRTYATCLSLGYAAIFVRLLLSAESHGVTATLRTLVLYSLPFKKSRRYVSAGAFWTVAILAATVAYPTLAEGREAMVESYVSVDSLRKMIWMGMVRTLANQAITYAPLFQAADAVKRVDDDERTSPWSVASRGLSGLLCTHGLRGAVCSCGILLFVQCCTQVEGRGVPE